MSTSIVYFDLFQDDNVCSVFDLFRMTISNCNELFQDDNFVLSAVFCAIEEDNKTGLEELLSMANIDITQVDRFLVNIDITMVDRFFSNVDITQVDRFLSCNRWTASAQILQLLKQLLQIERLHMDCFYPYPLTFHCCISLYLSTCQAAI